MLDVFSCLRGMVGAVALTPFHPLSSPFNPFHLLLGLPSCNTQLDLAPVGFGKFQVVFNFSIQTGDLKVPYG